MQVERVVGHCLLVLPWRSAAGVLAAATRRQDKALDTPSASRGTNTVRTELDATPCLGASRRSERHEGAPTVPWRLARIVQKCRQP
jgi:hypothetical protein